MLSSDNPVLRARALVDLTKRARNAIPLYLLAWIVLSLWAELTQRAPLLFFANLIILAIIATLRTWHYRRVMRDDPDIVKLGHWLAFLLLLSALHWGLLSAWLVHNPAYADLRNAFMTMLAAFSMGGTPILAISRVVRTWYPVLMLLPCLFGGLFTSHTDEFAMSFLIVLALVYINLTSRMTGADYERASVNRILAEQRAERLDELRMTDGLTGLKNRRYFEERFELDWAMCQRHTLPLSVLMIDLDHFKALNDHHGHLCGDHCLRAVAGTLQGRLTRSTDTIARYGGEEFVALLPGTSEEAARRLAQSIVDKVAALELHCDEAMPGVTCSVGVSSKVPTRGEQREILLGRADKALYAAKQQGRNRVVVDDSSDAS